MSRKKFFLKNIDSESADKISENYPAEWNMDRVFDLSCKKYLALKKNIESKCEHELYEKDEIFEFSDTKKGRDFLSHIFTLNKLIAAVCAAAIIMLAKMVFATPNNINSPPDIIEQNPIASHECRTTSAKENNSFNSTALYSDVFISVDTKSTDVALHGLMNNPTESIEETEEKFTEIIEETQYQPPEEEHYDKTEETIQSELIETKQTEQMAITTQAAQTTEPITTASSEKRGYFHINKGNYIYNSEEFDELVYIRTDDTPVEKRTHVIDTEEFSVCDDSDSKKKIKAEKSGQIYLLYTIDYEEFSMNLNPKFDYDIEYFEINGRPAIYKNDRTQPDEQYEYIMLMWDDGCHISFTFGLQMYYDEMLKLAECF